MTGYNGLMWRLLRASLSIVLTMVGILLGVVFIWHNPAEVNVQFPLIARESGPVPLGIALLVAAAAGMGVALVIAFVASVGMSLYAARLKREIKSLRREVDSLRNLPLLEEEIERETDEEDGEELVSTARSIDVIPDGPVRAGSTAAPIGGYEDEDGDEEEDETVSRRGSGDEDIDVEGAKTVPSLPASGSTRKLDVT